MDIQCDNCLDWFLDSAWRWESYHECPCCGAYNAQEQEDESDD
jgi:hypothetical protein